MHVHSCYSDGSGSPQDIVVAANTAGVDIVWLTDHDTLRAQEAPGQGYFGRVLLLVGSEITPARNHYLTFGNEELVSPTRPFSEIVTGIRQMRAVGIIAHPDDGGNPRFGIPSYRWDDRAVQGYTGLEVWNHLSQWSAQFRSVPGALGAMTREWWRGANHPNLDTLMLWDDLGKTRAVVGIGGVDAHAHPLLKGLVRIFPYDTHFRTIRTQFFVSRPLAGHWPTDHQLLLDALAQGHVAVMSCFSGCEKGFRFWAESADHLITPMGGTMLMSRNIRLKAISPVPVDWRLIHNGIMRHRQHGTYLEYFASDSGVWRLELWRRAAPWILSNPIYIR